MKDVAGSRFVLCKVLNIVRSHMRGMRCPMQLGQFIMFSKLMTGASHHELYCLEPRPTVGVLKILFSRVSGV